MEHHLSRKTTGQFHRCEYYDQNLNDMYVVTYAQVEFCRRQISLQKENLVNLI